jgi:hypothetical protein
MDLRAKVVQYRYLMPKLQQVAREMSANKSGSAGNENVHRIRFVPVFVGICPDNGNSLREFLMDERSNVANPFHRVKIDSRETDPK